jgi:ParB-like chromosome segregation protein Spo0J
MVTKLNTKKMPVSKLRPAAYNPRVELQESDPEFQALLRSYDEFGDVEAIVWNKRTDTVVGGHQRLKLYELKGVTETDVVVVDLNEADEKILNIALNKISGRWDPDKLGECLKELEAAGALDLTGFEEWEMNALIADYEHIDDLMNEDFSDNGKGELDTFIMTFTLPEKAREAVDKYTEQADGKKLLSIAIMEAVRGTA